MPSEEGLRLAALIPGARFVPLDSDNHVLLDSEPAWDIFLAEVRRYLGSASADALKANGDDALTPAERSVLRLVALGLDSRAIAR